MTLVVEPVCGALKTALRTGFVSLENFSLTLWTLHGGNYCILPAQRQVVQAICNDFEMHPQNPMDVVPAEEKTDEALFTTHP